ncbi:hypothetical protein JHK87_018597 [Glycine soja]|nr:hypothetical protein JHK87_018597 [Glycine soja]KAG5037881.1 hypothetical protein JHK86_018721 [Glycine max]
MAEVAKPVNNVDASNPVPLTATFANSLPNVSKIEVFTGQNFLKYTTEDMVRQRFIIVNYYHWTMNKEKGIKVQINESYKLLEDLKIENISLPNKFVFELLIKKLSKS